MQARQNPLSQLIDQFKEIAAATLTWHLNSLGPYDQKKIIQSFMSANAAMIAAHEYRSLENSLADTFNQAITKNINMMTRVLKKEFQQKFRLYTNQINETQTPIGFTREFLAAAIKDCNAHNPTLSKYIYFIDYHSSRSFNDILITCIQSAKQKYQPATIDHLASVLFSYKNITDIVEEYISIQGGFFDLTQDRLSTLLGKYPSANSLVLNSHEANSYLGKLILDDLNFAMYNQIQALCLDQIKSEIQKQLTQNFIEDDLSSLYKILAEFKTCFTNKHLLEQIKKTHSENSITLKCLSHNFCTQQILALSQDGLYNILKNEINHRHLSLANKILSDNSDFISTHHDDYIARPVDFALLLTTQSMLTSGENLADSKEFITWFSRYLSDNVLPVHQQPQTVASTNNTISSSDQNDLQSLKDSLPLKRSRDCSHFCKKNQNASAIAANSLFYKSIEQQTNSTKGALSHRAHKTTK